MQMCKFQRNQSNIQFSCGFFDKLPLTASSWECFRRIPHLHQINSENSNEIQSNYNGFVIQFNFNLFKPVFVRRASCSLDHLMNLMKSRGIFSYKLISLVSSGWVKRATTQTSRCRAKEDVSSEQRDDVLSAKCVFQQKFLLAHSSSRISDNTDEIWGTLNSLLRYLQMRVSITSLNIACNNPCGVHWYLYQLSFLRAQAMPSYTIFIHCQRLVWEMRKAMIAVYVYFSHIVYWRETSCK